MKEKKMTNKDYFMAIKEIVADNAELVEFCDKQINALNRKNTSGNSKRAAERDEKMKAVYNAIVELGRPATCTEIANALGEGWSTNKVAPCTKALVADGKVARTDVKRVGYFTIAE